jgi:hypothetical protein
MKRISEIQKANINAKKYEEYNADFEWLYKNQSIRFT